MALCGIFNGGGRLVFPWISESVKNKIMMTIALVECVLISLVLTSSLAIIPFVIVLINATYGGAFACLPSVLERKYGKANLSQTHGFCLSAWGCASLFAYLCSSLVAGLSPHVLIVLLFVVYVCTFFVSMKLLK